MRYIVITEKNFDDIERVMKDVENRAREGYKKNNFDGYKTENFCIQDEKAISMFEEKYGYKFTNWEKEPKTDGKTIAKIIPYVMCSCYYDARDGGRGGLTDVYNHNHVRHIIEFDGVQIWPLGWTDFDKPTEMSLFNDTTDYHNYLPYNWGKENPAPNRIGTLSDKKLKQWVDYLVARKTAAANAFAGKNREIEDFLAKVRKIDASKCTMYHVSDTRGTIVRNGIEFTYKITSGGYIEKTIGVHYSVKKDLESFEKMVVGKYTK